MVEGCLANYARIDVLQNNVGTLAMGGPVETSEEDWDLGQDTPCPCDVRRFRGIEVRALGQTHFRAPWRKTQM